MDLVANHRPSRRSRRRGRSKEKQGGCLVREGCQKGGEGGCVSKTKPELVAV